MGGGNHADVDASVARLAHALDRARLERAQEARLHVEREIANLVEEQRAPVRELESPARPATAPVNAPRACRRAGSISVGATAAQSNTTNGPKRRGDASWMLRAMTSFPVPVSP